MKTRRVGAEFFHADKGRTDRDDEANRSFFVLLWTRLKMYSSNFDWVVSPFQMTHQFNYSSQQRSPLEDSYRSTSFVFEQKRVFWPIWFAQPPTSQIAWKALFAGRHFCLKVPTILCLLVALQMVGVFLHFFTGLHIVVLCYKNKFTVRPAFTLTAHSSSRTICMFLFETTLCCQ